MFNWSFSDLCESFSEQLSTFPFQSDEEAKMMNVKNYSIFPSEEYTALEYPFSFKKMEHKMAEEVKEDEFEASEDDDYDASEASSNGFQSIDLDLDLFINGKQIIDDSQVKLINGMKYGLVGRNGIGKTTLLRAIKNKQFKMPTGIKIHLIKQEFNSKKTVIDYVGIDGGRSLQLLGFAPNGHAGTKAQQAPTYSTLISDLSGGWRMRVQLAKAIHRNPELLLLDEPTNFLDIKSINFLEKYIGNLKTVVIVSHDKHFLNTTCDYILHMDSMKITTYKGNYSSFTDQYKSNIERQIKEYGEQQIEIEKLETFINRFRANAKRSTQAQSRIKILEKMDRKQMPKVEPRVKFRFIGEECKGQLIELRKVGYTYQPESLAKDIGGDGHKCSTDSIKPNNSTKYVFRNVDFKIDSRARIVIVGENGQGKSTLLKLIYGKLSDKGIEGECIVNPDCKIAYFAQHHLDHLDHSMDALSYLMKSYSEEDSRRRMSNFGLITNQMISSLSGGQKSRLAFAKMGNSNLLILDEPTNHLDINTINALSDAINEYKGAVICVSHDMAFLEACFDEVFICENESLARFKGTPEEYKNSLKE